MKTFEVFLNEFKVKSNKTIHNDENLPEYAYNLDLPKIEKALELGADVNSKDGKSGTCALEQASRNKQGLELVKYLLEKGANVNQTSDLGWTAFLAASLNGYLDIMEVLVDEGANVKAKTNRGHNALYYAQSKQAIDFLINHGVKEI